MNACKAVAGLIAISVLALVGVVALALADKPSSSVLEYALTTAIGAIAGLAVGSRTPAAENDDDGGAHRAGG